MFTKYTIEQNECIENKFEPISDLRSYSNGILLTSVKLFIKQTTGVNLWNTYAEL